MGRDERRWFSASRRIAALACVFAIALLGSCKKKGEAPPKAEPPLVTVAPVVLKTVPVHINYVGTIAAVMTVDIRARVEGFLEKRFFKEGADVKKGDLVYIIEREPYKAELEKSLAQLAKDEAAHAFAVEQVNRYEPLVKQDFVTREKFDDYRTRAKEAAAAVQADRAQVERARLNLSYCTMYSPINGRIGRTFVDVGNLVGAGGDTKLATIVQLDPIYVYFSPSDDDLRIILKYRHQKEQPVDVVLSDGTVHPHQGKVDFINNVVDPKTNTVTMRAVIPNPEKTLLPGVYVQAHLFLADFPNTPLIPEQAVAEDQGGTYVYVVGKDNKVQVRKVKAIYSYKGQKVAQEGLKEGELVIVEGMQLVRPDMVVRTKLASSKGDGAETKKTPEEQPDGLSPEASRKISKGIPKRPAAGQETSEKAGK
jgi:RND family efflux transporter MFP subunit